MLKTQSPTINEALLQKKVFFPNLDGLRCIAFFSVFMFHSFYTEYTHVQQSGTYQVINNFFSGGELGVNFFFVLSGFLITYLLLKEEALNGHINIPFFYVRRFLRIWPLYFFCVFFGFILFPFFKKLLGQIPAETADPFYFITFLSNFNNIKNGLPDASILGVLWSVAIEEQFYFFWPLAIILLKDRRVVLFAAVITSSIVFRYFNSNNVHVIYFHTLSVISDMAVGGLLGWFCYHKYNIVVHLRQISKLGILLGYILGVLLIIFRKDIFIGDVGITLERFILSLFFAFVIFEQNYAEHSWFKVGKSKWLTQWGKYTYGLYCLHFIGILTSTNLSKIIGTNTTVFGVLVWETLLALTITMIISWISYYYLEQPFLQAKKKFAFIVK